MSTPHLASRPSPGAKRGRNSLVIQQCVGERGCSENYFRNFRASPQSNSVIINVWYYHVCEAYQSHVCMFLMMVSLWLQGEMTVELSFGLRKSDFMDHE